MIILQKKKDRIQTPITQIQNVTTEVNAIGIPCGNLLIQQSLTFEVYLSQNIENVASLTSIEKKCEL